MNFEVDKYAGDCAWEEWFEVCAVDRCIAKQSLRRQRGRMAKAIALSSSVLSRRRSY